MLEPNLCPRAWAIVSAIGRKEILRRSGNDLAHVVDPTGTYSDWKVPFAAVQCLIDEGVLGDDLLPTAAGEEWLSAVSLAAAQSG